MWRQETHTDLKSSTAKYEFLAFFVAGKFFTPAYGIGLNWQ
jgi:hypothetical protein